MKNAGVTIFLISFISIMLFIKYFYNRAATPSYSVDKQGQYWLASEPSSLSCPKMRQSPWRCEYNDLSTAIADCNADSKCLGYWRATSGTGATKLSDTLNTTTLSNNSSPNTFYKKNS